MPGCLVADSHHMPLQSSCFAQTGYTSKGLEEGMFKIGYLSKIINVSDGCCCRALFS